MRSAVYVRKSIKRIRTTTRDNIPKMPFGQVWSGGLALDFNISTEMDAYREAVCSQLVCHTNELKKILKIISTALTIEHKIKHRRTPSKLEVGPDAREEYLTADLVIVLPLIVLSYKNFQEKIPNGESVPHPCKPNYVWQGVGHKNHLGGGDRNPFGIDFAQNGYRWTQELCNKDSDGDGRTNGEELGDPRCVWNEGEAPDVIVGLSHPAVPMTSPGPCGMGLRSCNNIIGLWAVGFQGECFHDQAGFLMGKDAKAYKRVAMQFHWNNPLMKNDYYDGSGLRLHLTKNKRTHNAGVLMVGQNYLQLTPGQDKIEVMGRCTSEMSKLRLTGPVHFTRALNHMHYLGRQMRMEHYRNGVKLRDLTFDEVYSYDSPVIYDYQEAIEFQRGDEVRTTCVFKTKERGLTVFQGDATSDEMCFGFLTYHPAENIQSPWCTEWRGIDPATFYYKTVIQNCPFKDFMNMTHPDTQRLHTRVLSHCSHLGLCLKECISMVRELRANHPCLQGDIHEYLRERARNGGMETIQLALFFSSIDSCNTEIAKLDCPVINNTPDPTSASCMINLSPLLILLVALHFFVKA
ncbi:hypothetical protein FSP39_005060 [Pinctada imbricata]|uniref:Uncharacterized protein n=1 Tax=Pinctada imbricata TaxID=66713 RepID=A0AA88YHF6_PINIB|nr:hypothetical protein FSP39_005060 [Pinctada imbricata]